MQESYLTQALRNAFDDSDTRTREVPYTLDAQLLNAAANVLEDFHERVGEEVNSRLPATVPLNLDNRGIWYSFYVPRDVELVRNDRDELLPPEMTGFASEILGGSTILTGFSSALAIPRRLTLSARLSFAYMGPLYSATVSSELVNLGSSALPCPNRLYIEISGMGPTFKTGEVVVVGQAKEQSLLRYGRVQPKQEIVVISDDGLYQTVTAWTSIESITIKNLQGTVTQISSMAFDYSRRPDARPATIPTHRETAFPRSWVLNGRYALEQYIFHRLAGYETLHAHQLPVDAVDILPEPNTYGMFICRGTTISFFNRRANYPLLLDRTGLTAEPLYGIRSDLLYDAGAFTVQLIPTPYRRASELWKYRYVVETETDIFVLTNGASATYTGSAGWVDGPPVKTSFTPWFRGSASISLETLTADRQQLWDTSPIILQEAQVLTSMNLPAGVPTLQKLCFDCKQQLWGLGEDGVAYPLDLHYDAYHFDAPSRLVYLTDLYDHVEF